MFTRKPFVSGQTLLPAVTWEEGLVYETIVPFNSRVTRETPKLLMGQFGQWVGQIINYSCSSMQKSGFRCSAAPRYFPSVVRWYCNAIQCVQISICARCVANQSTNRLKIFLLDFFDYVYFYASVRMRRRHTVVCLCVSHILSFCMSVTPFSQRSLQTRRQKVQYGHSATISRT